MKQINNKVIIWGIDNFNTLGLIRQLGQANIDLLFLIKGKAYCAAKSKYCKDFIETQSVEDGYRYLQLHFLQYSYKPILIVCGDDIMTYIDQHRDELAKLFILPGCDVQGRTSAFIDKNNMTKHAREIGMLCPDSQFVTRTSNPQHVEYPCLIKPSHERFGHFNEFKFKVCHNRQQLLRTLKFVHPESEFILQQYIPKEKDILIYGVRFRNGNIHLAGAFIKERTADDGSGSYGTITASIPVEVDKDKIFVFLQSINYYGLFSFEYGLFKDKAYFFEVNLRNDGTSHYFHQLGANLPLAYVYDAAGEDYTTIPTKIIKNGIFINELHDFENVLHRKVSYKTWKQDIQKASVYKFYNSQDISPFLIVKKDIYRHILSDILLKKFLVYIVYILDKFGLKK